MTLVQVTPAAPLQVWMLIYPRANLLDIAGPLQVFASASAYAVGQGLLRSPPYEVRTLSEHGGQVETSTGLRLDSEPLRHAPIDTLLIAGGHGSDEAETNPVLLDWIRRQQPLSRRTASVCSGAFLLAGAGLLEGRRAVTHFEFCDRLGAYSGVEVDADAIYVEDGPIWTSAGVLAGVDMAMAMVERDLGRRLALHTARQLVAASRRAGGQAQVGVHLLAQEAESRRLERLAEWIIAHPAEADRVDRLADQANLSVRSLHRRFRAELGVSPAAFVEQTRLETAKRLLEQTEDGVDRIAAKSGFGAPSRMRAAFLRRLGQTPSDYRHSHRP